MQVSYHLGLPEAQRETAAELYWHAFGGKLGKVMGPKPRALRFLMRVLRGDHAVVALDRDGTLLGMAGFKSPLGGFAGGEAADIRAIYGILGAMWRLPLLWMLERDIDNDRFLVDGVCVIPAARNLGIGTGLLLTLESEARLRGYAHIRLDVIDSNFRAKALYSRLGYLSEKSDDIGVLGLVFGFQSSTTMVKPL